jgi:hypothetical protein
MVTGSEDQHSDSGNDQHGMCDAHLRVNPMTINGPSDEDEPEQVAAESARPRHLHAFPEDHVDGAIAFRKGLCTCVRTSSALRNCKALALRANSASAISTHSRRFVAVCRAFHGSNENKISRGYRERALIEVEVV